MADVPQVRINPRITVKAECSVFIGYLERTIEAYVNFIAKEANYEWERFSASAPFGVAYFLDPEGKTCTCSATIWGDATHIRVRLDRPYDYSRVN